MLKKTRKWKLFFIVLATRRHQEKSHYKNTVISSFVANVCSLQQRGEVNNKFILNTMTNWSSPDEKAPSASLHCYSVSVHILALTD